MSEAKTGEAKTIHVDYDLGFPPEKVWRALTEPALVALWLMPGKVPIAAVVGHKFTFQGPQMGDWDGTIACEVLEVEPPKRFRYSWRGGMSSSRLDSEVTWTLTPTARGTKLTLEHSGFLPINANAFEAMSRGWKSMGEERLVAALAKME